MDFLITLVKVIHIISCLLLTVVVLLQSGKGGGMGAIGGGSSTTVFGGGGDSVLVRTAAIFSGIFILTSVSLAWFATRGYEQRLAVKAARMRASLELKNLKKYTKKADDALALAAKLQKHIKDNKPKGKDKAKVEKVQKKATSDITVAIALLKNIKNQIVSVSGEANTAKSKGDTAAAASVKKKADDIKTQIEKEEKSLKTNAKALGVKLEEKKR